jgi:hypothetical protein
MAFFLSSERIDASLVESTCSSSSDDTVTIGLKRTTVRRVQVHSQIKFILKQCGYRVGLAVAETAGALRLLRLAGDVPNVAE